MSKNKLRELRKDRNLTVRELSEKVNIDYSTISRIETGVTALNETYLLVLSKFFDVSADYLLGISNVKKSNLDEVLKGDDFQFALYGEVKDLTDEQKEMILSMVKVMNERNRGK